MILLDDLRRRLDVPVDLASDELLTHFLDVAMAALAPWFAEDSAQYQENVDEAILQLAVKMWDAGSRGLAGFTQSGDWVAPAPSSTPGMVRSVFGALGPALRMGGVSV